MTHNYVFTRIWEYLVFSFPVSHLLLVKAQSLQDSTLATSSSSSICSQASAYATLAKSTALESASTNNELADDSGLLVLPVSAESAGLLPTRRGNYRNLISGQLIGFCLALPPILHWVGQWMVTYMF